MWTKIESGKTKKKTNGTMMLSRQGNGKGNKYNTPIITGS
jgi:hypothetical protein